MGINNKLCCFFVAQRQAELTLLQASAQTIGHGHGDRNRTRTIGSALGSGLEERRLGEASSEYI